MFICLASLFSVSICDLLPGTLDDQLGFVTFCTSLFCCLSFSTDLFYCDKVACLMICVNFIKRGDIRDFIMSCALAISSQA